MLAGIVSCAPKISREELVRGVGGTGHGQQLATILDGVYELMMKSGATRRRSEDDFSSSSALSYAAGANEGCGVMKNMDFKVALVAAQAL